MYPLCVPCGNQPTHISEDPAAIVGSKLNLSTVTIPFISMVSPIWQFRLFYVGIKMVLHSLCSGGHYEVCGQTIWPVKPSSLWTSWGESRNFFTINIKKVKRNCFEAIGFKPSTFLKSKRVIYQLIWLILCLHLSSFFLVAVFTFIYILAPTNLTHLVFTFMPPL